MGPEQIFYQEGMQIADEHRRADRHHQPATHEMQIKTMIRRTYISMRMV